MALDLANQRLHGLAVHREIDDGARGLDPLQRLLQGLGLELERLRVAPVAVDHGGDSSPGTRPPRGAPWIGRAACRGRGEISGGGVSFKKKKKQGQERYERRLAQEAPGYASRDPYSTGLDA